MGAIKHVAKNMFYDGNKRSAQCQLIPEVQFSVCNIGYTLAKNGDFLPPLPSGFNFFYRTNILVRENIEQSRYLMQNKIPMCHLIRLTRYLAKKPCWPSSMYLCKQCYSSYRVRLKTSPIIFRFIPYIMNRGCCQTCRLWSSALYEDTIDLEMSYAHIYVDARVVHH